jgi:phage gp29-like protein
VKDESQLLRDACRGDAQAQSELFASRIDPLIRLAYLITRDHAAAPSLTVDRNKKRPKKVEKPGDNHEWG